MERWKGDVDFMQIFQFIIMTTSLQLLQCE